KDFNAVYPRDTPGKASAGTSLGAYGPTAVPGQTTPVITVEAPGFGALKSGPATDARTVDAFERPLEAALVDPATLATEADRNILKDIDALVLTEKIGLLTGTASSKEAAAIRDRIQMRVKTAIENLKAMKPPAPLTVQSDLRLFSDDTVT